MEAYIAQNRAAYDQLANEYAERLEYNMSFSKNYLGPLDAYLDNNITQSKNLLDIGCGSGYHLKIFSDKGYNTTGIDLSSEMIKIATNVAPNAKLINNNFLDVNLPASYYDLVIAIATIHNYTKSDALKALKKIYTLMNDNGCLFLTTNLGQESEEGFFSKKDYINKIQRFRKFRTLDELQNAIHESGFKIEEMFKVKEEKREKEHINIIASKIK